MTSLLPYFQLTLSQELRLRVFSFLIIESFLPSFFSSRFTDSKRYESFFEKCFRMEGEIRSGEICNACVLLVKRFQRLPTNTTKHWNHVVDARSGPGLKSLVRTKGGKIVRPIEDSDAVTPEKFKKKHVYKKKYKSKRKLIPASHKPFEFRQSLEDFSRESWRKPNKDTIKRVFEQPRLLEGILEADERWSEEVRCCGTVFRGPNGELGVDARYVYPCAAGHDSGKPDPQAMEAEDAVMKSAMDVQEDFDSSCSVSSASAHAPSAVGAAASLKLKLTATDLTSGKAESPDDEGFFDKQAGSPASSVYTGASTPPPVACMAAVAAAAAAAAQRC